MMHGNQQPAKDWEVFMFQYCGATCTDTVSHPMFSLVKGRSSTRWRVRQKTSQLVLIIFRVGYLRNEAKKRKKGPKEFDWSKATFHHFVTWVKSGNGVVWPTTRLPKLTASKRTWKIMMGWKRVFSFGMAYVQGRTVSSQEGKCFSICVGPGACVNNDWWISFTGWELWQNLHWSNILPSSKLT